MAQPTQPAFAQPPKRKHRKWPWILLFLAVACVLLVIDNNRGGSPFGKYSSPAGASSSQPTVSAPAPQPAASAPAASSTVVYQVTSDASSVSVTYASLKDGGLQESQNNNVTVPWSKTVQADKVGVHGYSLLAQMQPVAMGGTGHDGSSISCKITVDGKVIIENTSTGQYAAVTCAG